MFCTAKGLGAGGTAVIEDQVMDGSIEDLFVRLKHKCVLSDKDSSAKVPKITLHIYIYEIEWDNEEADNTPDITEIRPNSKGKSRAQKSKDSVSATPGPSGRPVKRALYQSEYQRHPSAQGSIQLSFETFKFWQTTCTIAADGAIEPMHCEDLEEISIARNWQTQHHAKQPGGAYLRQGLTELAIRGRYKGLDYAILQCKPISSSSNTNVKDLSDELCLLHKAQYFMDSFYKCALAHSIKGLPNSEFKILISDIQGIIAPDHSVTLFDPQAHTETQDSGYWDKGLNQIQLFQTLHDCNQFCKALELEQHVPGLKHQPFEPSTQKFSYYTNLVSFEDTSSNSVHGNNLGQYSITNKLKVVHLHIKKTKEKGQRLAIPNCGQANLTNLDITKD
ncbi:hypothetical protein DFH29DRAFT_871058 [Suillus ampliporus]|nr:hypothetical protein DFH29DRAFT_871058 [Suillus ampliporus]